MDKRYKSPITPPAVTMLVIVGIMLLATVGCGGGGGGGGSLSSGTGTSVGITTGTGTGTGTGDSLPVDGGTVTTPATKKDTERTYQENTNLAIQGRALATLKGGSGRLQVSPLGHPLAKPLNLKEGTSSKETYQGTLSQGQWFAYYQVGGSENVVPAGTEVSVSLAGPANADFDLYIKAGDLPTTSSFDDRGFSPSSSERVHVITEQASRVYVLVVAYSGTGNYTLSCDQSVTLPQATSVTLANNTGTAAGTLATNGAYSRFIIPAVPNQARLTVTMTGATGTDFDLFARVGAPPTVRIADAVALGNTSSEVLHVTNRSGATRDVYVTVLSASGTGGFTLQFALTLAPANEVSTLTPGLPANHSLARTGDYRLYRIAAVPADTQLRVDLQGPGTADFDLFVRMGAVPTLCASDAISVGPSSTEHCNVRTGAQVQDAYVLVRSFRGSGDFNVVASLSANPTEGGAITPDVPTTGNLGGDGAQVFYYVADVAPNTYLSAHLVGLQTSQGADFDVYVRLDQPPTVTDYDARGFGPGCVENASLTVPGTETVKAWFMVRSYRGSGSYALLVDSPTPAATTITLPTTESAVATVDHSLSGSGDSVLFVVPAVPDQATLAFDLAGVNPTAGADFDLYVRRDQPPTATLYDAMGLSPSTTEHCVVTTSQPNQDVYVRVRSFRGSGAFTLTVRRLNAAVIPITLGDPVTGTLAQAGDSFMYVARSVPAGLTVTGHLVGPASGTDFDLYVRKGAPPTLTTYDARGCTAGSDESVATVVASPADVYIWVRSTSGSGGFTLTTGPSNGNSGAASTTLLSSGTPVAGNLDTQLASRYYRIEVPADSNLEVSLTPGTPTPAAGTDFDLYVRRGEMPTTATYDAVGFSPTTTEQCRVSIATAQTVFIMVKSYAGTGNFNLVATASPVIITPPPAGSGRFFLMTIGINDYPGTGSDLSWCVKDAEDLKFALPAVAATQSAHLRDGGATKSAIQQKLLDIRNGTNGMTQIGSDDTLVLAYSGHGSNSGGLGYLVVWGLNSFDYISSTELQSWLGDLPSGTRKIVMLDSCFSGRFVNRAVGGEVTYRFVPMKGSDPHFSGRFLGSTGTRSLDALTNLVGLMACAGTEYSMESSSIQNGAYTHYLVQGLGGSAGVYGPADANQSHTVTVAEASAYATPRVTASFSSQHPQLWDGGGAYANWILKY